MTTTNQTAERAIQDSIRQDQIVHLSAQQLGAEYEIVREALRAAATDSASAEEFQCWGESDGDTWRVHVGLPQVASTAWQQPQELAGQTIDASYGQDDQGECWERTISRATRETRYSYLGHITGCKCWEPWQSIPEWL